MHLHWVLRLLHEIFPSLLLLLLVVLITLVGGLGLLLLLLVVLLHIHHLISVWLGWRLLVVHWHIIRHRVGRLVLVAVALPCSRVIVILIQVRRDYLGWLLLGNLAVVSVRSCALISFGDWCAAAMDGRARPLLFHHVVTFIHTQILHILI